MEDSPAAPVPGLLLTKGQAHELDALQRLADAGRLKPASDAWDRWLALIRLRDEGHPLPEPGNPDTRAATGANPAQTPASAPGLAEDSTSVPRGDGASGGVLVRKSPPSNVPSPGPVPGPGTPTRGDTRPASDRALAAFYFPTSAPAARIKHISRIRAAARTINLPAPLHNPLGMLEWIATAGSQGIRFSKSTVQAFENAALQAARGAATLPVGAPPQSPAHATSPSPDPAASSLPVPGPPPLPEAPITASDTDPASVLRRLEENEVLAYRALEAARRLNAPNTDLLQETLRRRHAEATAAVAVQRQHLEKHGHLIPVATASAAYRRIIHPLPQLVLRVFLAHPPGAGEPWESAAPRLIRTVFESVKNEFRDLIKEPA